MATCRLVVELGGRDRLALIRVEQGLAQILEGVEGDSLDPVKVEKAISVLVQALLEVLFLGHGRREVANFTHYVLEVPEVRGVG